MTAMKCVDMEKYAAMNTMDRVQMEDSAWIQLRARLSTQADLAI